MTRDVKGSLGWLGMTRDDFDDYRSLGMTMNDLLRTRMTTDYYE